MREAADLDASPRGAENAGSSITAVNRLGPRAQRPIYDELADAEQLIEDDEASWRAPGFVPGSPHAGSAGPQGVAESTTPRVSAFTHINVGMARELAEAAPLPDLELSQSPMPISAPHRLIPNTTNDGSTSTPPRTGRVQFSSALDNIAIPGEILPSLSQRATPTSAHYAPAFSTVPSGFTTVGPLSSPERALRMAGALRQLPSARTGAFGGDGGLGSSLPAWHLALLEQPQQVAEVPLELTLQHSTRIEKVSAAELLPFAPGERPFVSGYLPGHSCVRGIRSCSELRRGCFFVPSDITDLAASGTREVISGVLSRPPRSRAPVFVQLYVLFPSLMRPPRWLRRDFNLVKKAAVEMSWDIPRRLRFLLHAMRRLQQAEAQYLAVWAAKRRFGPGEAFTLYGAEGTAEMTDRSYVLVMKFYEKREGPAPARPLAASREGPLPLPPAATSTAAAGDNAVTSFALPPNTSGRAGEAADAAATAGGDAASGGAPLGPMGTGHYTGMAGGAGGAGGGAGGGLLGSTARGGGGGATRIGTLSRTEALRELHAQMLLHAQSSEVAGMPPVPESGSVTWDSALDYALATRDSAVLRTLIQTHNVDHLLRAQQIVDQVEKVAMSNNDPGLLLLLYDHTRVEMDLQVLAFLVHAWAVQPVGARAAAVAAARLASTVSSLGEEGGLQGLPDYQDAELNVAARVEEFLVKYVVKRRNPLSATAAILRAVQDEMYQHEENRRTMRLALSRFHSLHLALLRKLNRYADARNIRQVERILQPAELPNTVNEVSPLQVAFDSQDLKFMTETLIEMFVKVQWAGGELLALTAHEDPRATGATNPLLAYAVLRSLGFAGKGTFDPLVMAASRLWHLYAFTSTAFFNSPRGRWAMHALFELAFLVLYQWQVMYPKVSVRMLQSVHLVFLAFILGNLLDMAQFVHYRYGSLARIHRFLSDPWNALGLIVNACLMVLTVLKLAQEFGAPGLPRYTTGDAVHMCMATLAVFVWVRALGMAVPVYPSLGPLLNTVARMMEEVIAFLFPMLIVMTGFSTMMSAIYQDLVPGYANFASAMLQLFSSMLGNFDFTLFDELDVVKKMYGIIVQVIFLVISAILLMNLLIAIITNRYRPQEVEAETAFKKAQIVNYYQTQVTRNLVCSPFCLLHLTLSATGLPAGSRPKIGGSSPAATRLALLPLDGVLLPDDGGERPTGVGEIPHLIFLCTLYPIMAVSCWLLFLLYTPFGVWQFATKRFARFVKEYSRKHTSRAKRGKPQPPAKARASPSKPPNKTTTKATKGDVETPASAAAPGALAAPAAIVTTIHTTTARGSPSRPPHTSPSSAPSSSSLDIGAKQFYKLKKALQAEAQQTEMSLAQTAAYMAGTSALTLVGLGLYLIALLGVAVVGWSSLYQWVAKLLFSLYNVLVKPWADMIKARRRRMRRVAPAPQPSAASSSQQPAAAFGWLFSTSGRRTAASALGPPEGGAEGCVVCNTEGANSNGGAEGQRGGGAAAGGGAGGAVLGHAAAALAAREAEAEWLRRRKARLHWRHAIQRVIALKNERYLSPRDVLKALAASKFKPHMAGWQLSADLRSSSQDILDDQLQDLEDDDDAWDDDEVAAEDNDEIEGVILERTEALTEIVRNGLQSQQTYLACVWERLDLLAEDVARIAGNSTSSGSDGYAAAAGGTADGAASAGGGSAAADSAAASPGPSSASPPPPSVAPPSIASETPSRRDPWESSQGPNRTPGGGSGGARRPPPSPSPAVGAALAEVERIRRMGMPPRPRPPPLAMAGLSGHTANSARVSASSSGTPMRSSNRPGGMVRPGSAVAAVAVAALARAAAGSRNAAAATAGVQHVGSSPVGYPHYVGGDGGSPAAAAAAASPPSQQHHDYYQGPPLQSSNGDGDSDFEVGEDVDGASSGGGEDVGHAEDAQDGIMYDASARDMARGDSDATDGYVIAGGGSTGELPVTEAAEEELSLLDAATSDALASAAATDRSPTPALAPVNTAAAAAAASLAHGAGDVEVGVGGRRTTSGGSGGGLPPLHPPPPPPPLPHHQLLRHPAGADAAPPPPPDAAMLDPPDEAPRSYPGRRILSPLPGGPSRQKIVLGPSLSGARVPATGAAAAAAVAAVPAVPPSPPQAEPLEGRMEDRPEQDVPFAAEK